MPLVQTGGKEKTDTPRLPRSSPHFLGQPFSFESRFPPIPGPSFPFRPAIFFPGLLSSSPACCPLPWPAVLFSDPLSSSPARCLLPRPAVFFPGPLSSSPARRPLRRPAALFAGLPPSSPACRRPFCALFLWIPTSQTAGPRPKETNVHRERELVPMPRKEHIASPDTVPSEKEEGKREGHPPQKITGSSPGHWWMLI